jgi:hypothetical protein
MVSAAQIVSRLLEFPVASIISQGQEPDEIIFAEMVAVLVEKLAHEPLFLREFHEIPQSYVGIGFAHNHLLKQRFSEAGTSTSGGTACCDGYFRKR